MWSQEVSVYFARLLDVGLVGPIDCNPPLGLYLECFSEESPVVGMPSDHRFARLPKVSLTQLKDEPFILTSAKNSPNYRSLISRMCERAGFVPQVVQESDRPPTAAQYLPAAFAISSFPAH